MSGGQLFGCDVYYDGILPGVEKPSRYIDHELNLTSKGFAEEGYNVLLVFPDVYEIGMSHQGLRFLYHALSRVDGVGVEFAFAPWPDMEDGIRETGECLRSWQTGTPASRFDIIGITLSYELHYTNALTIMDLAGLPVVAAERDDIHPLVVAGGPCVSNPLPVIGAFDAFFLGDGEESLVEAVKALKETGRGRRERLETLAAIDGVYVDGISDKVSARTYLLGPENLPLAPIVPSGQVVHDRLAVEVMRGCTRGCRFCHAGMTYRPRRERTVGDIVRAATEGLDKTGWEEVSLLSLSTSDYSRLEELLKRLAPELTKRHVSLALPSLRPETITDRIIEATAAVRKSGFTIAPEAGTERLRAAINKDMSDVDILDGCSRILEAGWQNLKLYFMIGLPTETQEDLDGIVSLIEKIMGMRAAKGRFRLGVSISPFVPKAHTPFQWERQCSMEEIAAKEKYLSSRIRHRKVDLGLREPRVSALEGVLARGGRDVWPIVLDAWRSGCRFDSWRDRLRFDLWEKAIEKKGTSIDQLLSGFDPNEPLPWEAFTVKVSKSFLLRERERAIRAEVTADCRNGICGGCGACTDEAERRAGFAPADDGKVSRMENRYEHVIDSEHEQIRYRFVYRKTGRARFLSHREITNIITRALRRSGLPLRFSKGFHPHAKMSLGPALAVGTASEMEFFDVEFTRDGDIAFRAFDGLMPPGLEVTASAGPFTRAGGKLPEEVTFEYEIDPGPLDCISAKKATPEENLSTEEDVWYRLDKEPGGDSFADAAGRLEDRWSSLFSSAAEVTDRRGRIRSTRGCSVSRSGAEGKLILRIEHGPESAPVPADLLRAVMPEAVSRLVVITRTGIYYRQGDALLEPLDLITGNI
ncbi:MAG: TIGR03936 family radical SAM-associated protein [Candidatus Krumholzibacteria bacterium]|nr:TIGR03936 family radical SAM-associated protein [Candidatus Krumholzibacteria bacterium]